jgi:hypothetical protein
MSCSENNKIISMEVRNEMYACGDNCANYKIINVYDSSLIHKIGSNIFVKYHESYDSIEILNFKYLTDEKSEKTISHYIIYLTGYFDSDNTFIAHSYNFNVRKN